MVSGAEREASDDRRKKRAAVALAAAKLNQGQVDVSHVVGGQIVPSSKRLQRYIAEPVSGHNPNGQRYQEAEIFGNVCITDPFADIMRNEDSVGDFKRPNPRHYDIRLFDSLKD